MTHSITRGEANPVFLRYAEKYGNNGQCQNQDLMSYPIIQGVTHVEKNSSSCKNKNQL